MNATEMCEKCVRHPSDGRAFEDTETVETLTIVTVAMRLESAWEDLKGNYTEGVRETLTVRGGVSSHTLCPEIPSNFTVWRMCIASWDQILEGC